MRNIKDGSLIFLEISKVFFVEKFYSGLAIYKVLFLTGNFGLISCTCLLTQCFELIRWKCKECCGQLISNYQVFKCISNNFGVRRGKDISETEQFTINSY